MDLNRDLFFPQIIWMNTPKKKKLSLKSSTKFAKKAINRFAKSCLSYLETHLENRLRRQLLSGLRMWSGKHINIYGRHGRGMISLLWISMF